MENILEITSVALRGDTLSQLSAQMRETQSATRRGIEQAVPASVAALASHASSEQRAEELLGAFRGGTYPHVDAAQVAEMTADPEATSRLAQSSKGFLGRIFGNRLSPTVDAIAGQSGLSRSSASTLLGLAAPLVLGAVGKEAQTRNLDARGLSRFLADQGRRASTQLPGPLSTAISGVEGTAGELRTTGGEAVQRGRGAEAMHKVRETGAEMRRPTQSHKGLWWALLGIGLLALLALLMFGRRAGRPDVTTPDTDTQLRQAAPGEAPRAEPRPETRPEARPEQPQAAPAQPQQQAAPAQPQQQVATLSAATGAGALSEFIAGSDPTPRRFALEGLEFPVGSAELPANSMLDQVASELTKNDSVRVRLEGFADPTGPAELNQQLSQARAQSVKDYLVDHGAEAGRIEAVGLSSERPIANNQSTQGRAENRRVELVVLSR